MQDKVMEQHDEGMASSDSVCHFLRIPKEIRLEIYRYLLLPDPSIYICPDTLPPAMLPTPFDSEEDSEEAAVDEWTDEDEYDSDMDSMMSEFMHDMGRELFSDGEDSSSFNSNDEDDEEEPIHREFAILRTNSQIHNEAQSLLYTEAVLTLDPGDIFSLAKKPQNLRFGYPNPLAWKHNPLFGIGKQDRNGVVTYGTSQLLGDIEPHIFAQFQKISFDAYFDDEHTQNLEMWIDDDTHIIRQDDAIVFKKMLRSSTLFKDLFTILFNSHRITSLEIKGIEVEIMANSTLVMADIEDETDPDEESEAFLENQAKVDEITEIANQKATELFLDSKLMDPLLKLSNVSKCDFKFGFEHLENEEAYEPSTKYVRMLRGMKDKIESNFKEPGGAA